MSKTTGNASSFSNLLGDISTAAQAEGWTEEDRYNDGTYDILALSNADGFYYYLTYDSDELWGIMSDSYTASSVWGSIPNRCTSQTKTTGLDTFPLISHTIFATSQEVYIAAEVEVGKFRHFGFGTLDKLDPADYVGGQFLLGQLIADNSDYLTSNNLHFFDYDYHLKSYGSQVRAIGLDALGKEYHASGITSATTGRARGLMRDGMYEIQNNSPMDAANPNTFNNRARYYPMPVFISDNGTSSASNWIPLGYLRNIRQVNNKLLSDKQADSQNPTWYIFPMTKKSSSYSDTPQTSKFAGVAYQE